MPIESICQPNTICIDSGLRLRKYDNNHSFAFDWYQDEETLKMVDGPSAVKYDSAKLQKMYDYLNKIGELYFIEVLVKDRFLPIGDVTFWKDDLPIVIGDNAFRGKGIGKKVLLALIQRAADLGYSELNVREIYTYNIASQKLFESVGFRKTGCTRDGYSYTLIITR